MSSSQGRATDLLSGSHRKYGSWLVTDERLLYRALKSLALGFELNGWEACRANFRC